MIWRILWSPYSFRLYRRSMLNVQSTLGGQSEAFKYFRR